AVLRKGKKIYAGSVEEVLRPTRTVAVAAGSREHLLSTLQDCGGLTAIRPADHSVQVDLADEWDADRLNRYLVERQVDVHYIEQKKSSLEEKFLQILRENDVTEPNRAGI